MGSSPAAPTRFARERGRRAGREPGASTGTGDARHGGTRGAGTGTRASQPAGRSEERASTDRGGRGRRARTRRADLSSGRGGAGEDEPDGGPTNGLRADEGPNVRVGRGCGGKARCAVGLPSALWTVCPSTAIRARDSSPSRGGAGRWSTATQLQATHCTEPPSWTGRWFTPKGDRWFRVWACPDHTDGLTGLRQFGGVVTE